MSEEQVVTSEDVGTVEEVLGETVSEASDARPESEPDRKARIQRDMAATSRARRGGVQSDDDAIARAEAVAEEGDSE